MDEEEQEKSLIREMHGYFLEAGLDLKKWGKDQKEALRRIQYCLTHAQDFADVCHFLAIFRFVVFNYDLFLEMRKRHPDYLESLEDDVEPRPLKGDDETGGIYYLTNAVSATPDKVLLITYATRPYVITYGRGKEGYYLFNDRKFFLRNAKEKGVMEVTDGLGNVLATFDEDGLRDNYALPYSIYDGDQYRFIFEKSYLDSLMPDDQLDVDQMKGVYQSASINDDETLSFRMLVTYGGKEEIELFSFMAIAPFLAKLNR